jgi:hypothetical protein
MSENFFLCIKNYFGDCYQQMLGDRSSRSGQPSKQSSKLTSTIFGGLVTRGTQWAQWAIRPFLASFFLSVLLVYLEFWIKQAPVWRNFFCWAWIRVCDFQVPKWKTDHCTVIKAGWRWLAHSLEKKRKKKLV